MLFSPYECITPINVRQKSHNAEAAKVEKETRSNSYTPNFCLHLYFTRNFLKITVSHTFFFLISRKINLDLLRTLTVNVIVCDTHEGEKEKVRKDVLLELLMKT